MTIRNLDKPDSTFQVLYNPQSRHVEYCQIPMMGTDVPMAQFSHGSGETLQVQLFFDSLSAGGEVGGTLADREKFTANSLLPSVGNTIDVRSYTKKVYELMRINTDTHVPPKLRLEWASLQFTGYLVSCTQNYIRFDENGSPVRATLDCVFQEHIDPGRARNASPLESPDTTKYRVVAATRLSIRRWKSRDCLYIAVIRGRQIGYKRLHVFIPVKEVWAIQESGL